MIGSTQLVANQPFGASVEAPLRVVGRKLRALLTLYLAYGGGSLAAVPRPSQGREPSDSRRS